MPVETIQPGAPSGTVFVVAGLVDATLAINLPSNPINGQTHKISIAGNFESSALIDPLGFEFEKDDYIRFDEPSGKWNPVQGNADIDDSPFDASWSSDPLNGASRKTLKTKIDSMDSATSANTIHSLGNGSDHSDVAFNNTHRGETSNPHAVTKLQIGLGNVENLKVSLAETTDPGTGNDNTQGYAIGSRWINVTLDKEFVALDVSIGAAVWKETTAIGGGGSIDINALAGKSSLVNADILLLEDSADTFNQKKVTFLEFKAKAGNSRTDAGITVTVTNVDEVLLRLTGPSIGLTTVNLPQLSTVVNNRMYMVVDSSGNAATNNIEVIPFAGDSIVESNPGGNPGKFILDSDDESITLVADKASGRWDIF